MDAGNIILVLVGVAVAFAGWKVYKRLKSDGNGSGGNGGPVDPGGPNNPPK